MVESNNTQEKTPDEVISKPKANSEPEVSSSLGEASPSPDIITFNLDMGIDLESES